MAFTTESDTVIEEQPEVAESKVYDDDEAWFPEDFPKDGTLEDLENLPDEPTTQDEADETEDKSADAEEETPAKADTDKKDNKETENTEPDKPANSKIKFTAKINHKEEMVELDESELAAYYQKAVNHDRLQEKSKETEAKLQTAAQQAEAAAEYAKAKGYDSWDAMIEAEAEKSLDEEAEKLAEDPKALAKAALKALKQPKTAPKIDTEDMKALTKAALKAKLAEMETETVPQRDFKKEVSELLEDYPDALKDGDLPADVKEEVKKGKSVVVAYAKWDAAQAKAQAAAEAAEKKKLIEQSNTQKKNAANAAAAPVKGTKGSVSPAKDDFLRGFDSEY